MCDRRTAGDNSSWNAHFYHQYLQQHTRMTQWIQNMHQNIPQHWQNSLDYQNHNCHPSYTSSHNDHQYQHKPVSQQENYTPQQRHHDRQQKQQKLQGNFRHNSLDDTHSRIRSETNVEYVDDNESDVSEEDSENNGSDCEWVLNVEPFLAFRAANAKSEEEEKASIAEEDDAKSEESIEFLDAILDENFEIVQLDDVGQMQKIYGEPSNIEANDDFEYDREARIILYGDRADRIAGLETSLEIMFDHINDVHQPIIYPV